MSAAANKSQAIGIKAIRIAHGFINVVILIAVLLMLVFGCYAVWDSSLVYQGADAKHYEIYKPTVENEGLSFQELQALNPEVFAWLTVYGTNIDYPVVQGEDNLKYVNTDAKGNHSLSGGIFLDFENNQNFSDFSSILYGHHLAKQAMFGEIEFFKDKSYFDARRYGTLYYGGKEHGLEFFAFIHADAYDKTIFRTKFSGRDEQKAYLERLMRTAINIRDDVPATEDDRIVLLSTCSANSTNGRDILIGKLTDEIVGDTFESKVTDTTNYIPVVDELSGLWSQAPLPARIIITALPPLLILLLAVLIYTNNKKKKQHDTKPYKGDE